MGSGGNFSRSDHFRSSTITAKWNYKGLNNIHVHIKTKLNITAMCLFGQDVMCRTLKTNKNLIYPRKKMYPVLNDNMAIRQYNI